MRVFILVILVKSYFGGEFVGTTKFRAFGSPENASVFVWSDPKAVHTPAGPGIKSYSLFEVDLVGGTSVPATLPSINFGEALIESAPTPAPVPKPVPPVKPQPQPQPQPRIPDPQPSPIPTFSPFLGSGGPTR